MTHRERIMAVIEGRLPDRVPLCPHNFDMAVGEAGASMEDYLSDPEVAAKVHLEAQAKYGYDCMLIDLDTTMLAEAMGANRDATPGQTGHIAGNMLESLDDAESLPLIDPDKDGRIPVLLEAIRIMRKEVGDSVAIRGNCDQMAFSLASLIRGMENFMMDLIMEPDHPGIQKLLERCYLNHLAVHKAVKAAGADFTSLGDSSSGPELMSPDMFRDFAKPWQERLVNDLTEEGIFVLIHICGNTTLILEDLATYPYCAFELDYKTDTTLAKQTVGKNHVLFGNIDPSSTVARGSVEEVKTASKELIECWKPEGKFVFNAGCGIPRGTPSENLQAMLDSTIEYGQY